MLRTWVKVHASILDKPWSLAVKGAFVSLLNLASEHDGQVYISERRGERIRYNLGQLAREIGASEEETRQVLAVLAEDGCITVDWGEAGPLVVVVNWSRYQSEYERVSHYASQSSEAVAGRMRRSRERAKGVTTDVTTPVTTDVTTGRGAAVTTHIEGDSDPDVRTGGVRGGNDTDCRGSGTAMDVDPGDEDDDEGVRAALREYGLSGKQIVEVQNLHPAPGEVRRLMAAIDSQPAGRVRSRAGYLLSVLRGDSAWPQAPPAKQRYAWERDMLTTRAWVPDEVREQVYGKGA